MHERKDEPKVIAISAARQPALSALLVRALMALCAYIGLVLLH